MEDAMRYSVLISLFIALLALCGLTGTAQADGIVIPEPCPAERCPVPPVLPCQPGRICPPPVRPMVQLEIKAHHVTVKIDNQVAVTHVDQTFYNPNTWTVEGTYVFPLPAGAAVSRFTLWVDGKPVDGKVLDAQAARRYYEEIVRQQRDPALLEYADRGAVQAKIYPIPAKGERRIELEYSQALTAEQGLVKYTYPLNTEKFSSAPLKSVSISVELRANAPLRAIYSPSHAVSVTRTGDRQASIGWEASQVKPDQDFVLYYSIGESEAFHLLSYRDAGDAQDPDGFFLLLLAPKPEAPERAPAKDLILVLDHSGSMEGEKLNQAKSALKYILGRLNPDDRFGLVAFSTSIEPYARGLRRADEAPEAVKWVERISAVGSTDINRALLEAAALADRERPTYLIFLTDGLPTTGETKREKITENFNNSAAKNVRLFPFGVGYDVDTYLLDTLAEQHHGLSTYVKPGEKLDEVLSGFYERISTPVLTDLELDFGKQVVYDIYPNPLPDLFRGSQVLVTGRYRAGGALEVTLKGNVNGQAQTFRYAGLELAQNSRGAGPELASLPRLWATRKIGYLLNQVRLKGANQELIDQIVKLSIRYGIVTPYTSYLVTEAAPLGAENQQRVAQDAYKAMQTAPAAPASGAGAVQKSAEQGAMAQAQQAPGLPQDATQSVVTVGARTFVYSQGVWTDTAFDAKKMTTQKISFLSDEYFTLARSQSDAAAALALGERVILVLDGKAYEITSSTPAAGATPAVTQAPTLGVTPGVTRQATAAPTVGQQTPATPARPETSDDTPKVILLLGVAVGIIVLGWWWLGKRP